MWIIANGKHADKNGLKEALEAFAQRYPDAEIHRTEEPGDAADITRKAIKEGVPRIIAAGGDGTVFHVINALMEAEADQRPVLGIVPTGTANDFATSAELPEDAEDALRLAAEGAPHRIDLAKANDRYFINVASGGFGAEVTASTPDEVKRWLGDSAYSLMGLVTAVRFRPQTGTLRLPEGSQEIEAWVAAVGNGRQAGGGHAVAPHACINDGLIDVMIVRPFPLTALKQVSEELDALQPDGEFIQYHQVTWAETHLDAEAPVNLDGEPHEFQRVCFEVAPGAIEVILPEDCPLLCENFIEASSQ